MRPASLRFRSGEFVMIGLPGDSLCSGPIPCLALLGRHAGILFDQGAGGPLTEHLQKIRPGDTIWIRRKPTGTLVLDALLPGRNLWLFATGTGIAPFASIIRDPESYEKFENLVLVQGCRQIVDLSYAQALAQAVFDDPLVGELLSGRLKLITATTQERSALTGRLTTCLTDGRLEDAAGMAIDSARDRAMICGSMAMLKDMCDLLVGRGFVEGSNARPAGFVIEKAFVG